uniref:Uncharacterized protein n=1 Tax=Oryza punctata TaxID=4537 RepID=A0A0E0LM16_ORYPU
MAAATTASTKSAVAAVTCGINAALRSDATGGDGAGGADGQNGCRSPGAKRVSDDGGKDDVWVAVDEADVSGASGGGRPPLFRMYKVKGIILHPYRFLILARLIAIVAFFAWRIRHKNRDGVWLWTMSMVGDVWFGFSWVLNQLPKLSPTKRVPDLAALADRHSSELPGVDVFVTTVDPVDEPILYTVNSILSILAADYPVDRYACYLSDDGGTLVHYEAMVEVAKFAELWVPFCRKHCVEPRAPENYFAMKTQVYKGGVPGELMSDHRRVRREYEEFKVRIDSLSSTIRQRSDYYIQKPFGTYLLYLVAVIAMIHVIGMFEVKWAGITLLDWCRNEQFYMIGSTGVYPTAVLYMALKLFTGKGIHFRLTSKQTTASSGDKFADLYTVRWVPLLIPTIVVMAVNVGAVGVAVGKAAAWGPLTEPGRFAVLGMVFNVWILVLLYPFALGVMGQWGKRPAVLFVAMAMAVTAVAAMYVAFGAPYQAELSGVAASSLGKAAASLTGPSG